MLIKTFAIIVPKTNFTYSLKYIFYTLLVVFASSITVMAQQIKLATGKNIINEDEVFTIDIIIKNGKQPQYDAFPEIKGFEKLKVISNADKEEKPLIITQQYKPLSAGTFVLPNFVMKINGILLSKDAIAIKVLPIEKPEPEEIITTVQNMEIKLDASHLSSKEPFLWYNVSSNKVFVGEAICVQLLMILPPKNKANLQFHEIGAQIQEIAQKIKPSSCAQQNFTLDSIEKAVFKQDDKAFTYFKLYQTYYFPISDKKIVLPQVNIKFAVPNSDKFVTLSSQQAEIEAKPLPAHPLKNSVPVGVFKLKEMLNTNFLQTGQSFHYILSINGIGNLAQISRPDVGLIDNFEIFDPQISKNLYSKDNLPQGEMRFNYYIVPQESGKYKLGDLFSLIYFDPKRAVYDTLKSKFEIQVHGESKGKMNKSLKSDDFFYEMIQNEKNFFVNNDRKEVYLIIAKVFIVIMLILLGVLIIKR